MGIMCVSHLFLQSGMPDESQSSVIVHRMTNEYVELLLIMWLVM